MCFLLLLDCSCVFVVFKMHQMKLNLHESLWNSYILCMDYAAIVTFEYYIMWKSKSEKYYGDFTVAAT
jgi:hypothetical protein